MESPAVEKQRCTFNQLTMLFRKERGSSCSSRKSPSQHKPLKGSEVALKNKIAILHHRLSDGERTDEWKRMTRGDAKIAIGARSAIFSPIQNLGLIIVDEEHEGSYKNSEEMPTYNARDLAVLRGSLSNSTVILGSATPSLESYTNALAGKYLLSELKERPAGAILPTVTIVDMRIVYERNKGFTHFSSLLLDGIQKRMEKGETNDPVSKPQRLSQQHAVLGMSNCY